MNAKLASYLVLHGAHADWAAPSTSVARLASVEDWPHTADSHALETLGFCSGETGAPERIVVLRRRGGEVGVRVRARVSFEDFDPARVCLLPPPISRDRPSVFRGVLFGDGDRAMLVLDPDRL